MKFLNHCSISNRASKCYEGIDSNNGIFANLGVLFKAIEEETH